MKTARRHGPKQGREARRGTMGRERRGEVCTPEVNARGVSRKGTRYKTTSVALESGILSEHRERFENIIVIVIKPGGCLMLC
jgi:hypothetical protein